MREPSWDDADPRPPYRRAPGPPPSMRGRAPGPQDRPDPTRARRPPTGERPATGQRPDPTRAWRPATGELPDATRGRRPPTGELPDATRGRAPGGWGRGTGSEGREPSDVRGRGAGPDGRGRGTGPNRPARGQRSQPASTSLKWGSLPGGIGVCIVIGGGLLGTMITVLAGSAPGIALGVFTVGGTVAAALAVKPRSAYLIVPVPALTYVVMATMAGLIHDQAAQASTTALAVNFAQWIASGFVAIIAATALAVGIAIMRRPRTSGTPGTRRGPSDPGHSPSDPEYTPPADRPARPRRPAGARPPAAPRRPERDVDYPPAPGSRGARGVGRYEPRPPRPPDSGPWERERWYRTDPRLTRPDRRSYHRGVPMFPRSVRCLIQCLTPLTSD